MHSMFKKFVLLAILLTNLIVALPSYAAISAWKIVPNESSLTFTATQNDAPVTGKFASFTGDINFDPNQLSQSNVKIVIDTNSISDAYNQLSDTLKTADWFNTKAFPHATFQSSEFIKTGNNTYQVKGSLTIRDKTIPVTLSLTQEEYSESKARMKGELTIKRTAFGVGQGQWADTKAVKDDVKIDFTVTGVKK